MHGLQGLQNGMLEYQAAYQAAYHAALQQQVDPRLKPILPRPIASILVLQPHA